MQDTDFDHLLDALHSIFTHLHDAPADGTPMRNMKRWTEVRVLKELPEFRLLNFIKRLITSDHPIREELFEFLLVPLLVLPLKMSFKLLQ